MPFFHSFLSFLIILRSFICSFNSSLIPFLYFPFSLILLLFYIFTTSNPLKILEVFRTLVAYGSDICPDWLFFFSCIQNTCRVVMAQRTTEFSTVSSVEHWSAEPFLKARVGFLIGTQFFIFLLRL